MVWGISVRKIAYRLGIANVKRYREFEKVRCVDLVWFRYLRVVKDGWKFDGGIFLSSLWIFIGWYIGWLKYRCDKLYNNNFSHRLNINNAKSVYKSSIASDISIKKNYHTRISKYLICPIYINDMSNYKKLINRQLFTSNVRIFQL